MSNAVEITISDVNNFQRCRHLWGYNSSLRRNLVPKIRASHFAFGDLVHEALRRHYQGENAANYFRDNAALLLKETDPSVPGYEKILDLVDMGPKLLKAYAAWAKPRDTFRVIDQEQRHVLRLNGVTPGAFFSFKYDILIEKQGQYYLLDFKTTSQMPSDTDYLSMDNQAVAYQAAAEKVLGIKISGMYYQYLRKKNPTVPALLKNGQLSKRSDIVTTVEVYREAIAQHGLDESGYVDILAHIASTEQQNFFYRTSVAANAYQKEQMLKHLERMALEMADPDVYIYRSPERMKCSVCDYKNPCFISASGYDEESILKDDYQKGEPRE